MRSVKSTIPSIAQRAGRSSLRIAMQGNEHPALVLLREARERVLEALSVAFRRDEIGLDEFEARVDRAFAARTPDELGGLIHDLSNALAALPRPGPVATSAGDAAHEISAPAALVVRSAAKPPTTMALFSSIERTGPLSIESGARVLAVFGNLELDLRDVAFPDGVTELYVRAVLGNVEIHTRPRADVPGTQPPLLGPRR